MNTVFTALAVLANITGFASGQRYDTSEEHLLDCMFEHYGELSPLADPNSILYSADVYDMDGTNRYLLLSFTDGTTSIYDKKEECISSTYESNPYEGYDNEFKLLGYIDNEYLFGYFDEELNDFMFINNTSMSKEYIHSYYGNQAPSYGNYYTNIDIPSNARIISNAFYFERLGNRHATNNSGTCAVISAEILFGYYDTFINDTIVDKQYDRPSVQNINKSYPIVRDFDQSAGVDTPTHSDFHDYLCDIATNDIHDDPTVGGMTVANQRKMMKKYMDDRGISYQFHCSESGLSELIANKAKTVIKETINQNRPVIAAGEGHTSVAFAYSDTMVWVHTGWGYTAATPWRTFESGMFYNYNAGAIDIMNICNNVHVCSDNYYAPNKNVYVCPSHGQVYKETDIAPIDYGFSTSYHSYEDTSGFYEEDEHVRVDYKRAALLSDNFISLSARRSGEGHAFVDYWMTKAIRHLKFSISFYSASEALSYTNSNIDFWTLRRFESSGNTYFSYEESLFDYNISTNRNNPTIIDFDFTGDEIYGFSISVDAPATGNADTGRVLIGNITIERSVNAHGYFSS